MTITDKRHIEDIIDLIKNYDSKGLGKIPIRNRLILKDNNKNSIEFYIWSNLLAYHQSYYSYKEDFAESIDLINLKYLK